MSEFISCARAFFIRDAQNALSYRFAFVFELITSLARTIALWLPAQLLGDHEVFQADGGFLAYTVTGSAMLGLFMASYGGFASSLNVERGLGTLESVFVTKASLSALLLGGATWTFIHALLDVLLTLVVAALLFAVQFRAAPLDLLVVVVLTNLSFIALGFLSAAFTVLFKKGDPFRLVVGGASVLLGGVFYPTSILPGFVSWVSAFLPITYGARALRGVALRGESVFEHATDLLILMGFDVVLLPLGLFAFYQAVARAKLEGTLFHY